MLTPLISNKNQVGFRLFDGKVLNAQANAINQLGLAANQQVGALTTVGNGTLTAALLAGGIIQRSGPTAAFTDTTDTGANLDIQLGSAALVGVSWQVNYFNNSQFTATIAGTTGVTASGVLTVPPTSNVFIQFTRTGVGTYTAVGLQADTSVFTAAQPVIATADNGTTQTLTAAMISGGSPTIHVSTGGATPSLTLPLATALQTALPTMVPGQSYVLRVINSNSGTATIVTNTGWTTSGTLTLSTGTWREFQVLCTAANAFTLTNIGSGTA